MIRSIHIDNFKALNDFNIQLSPVSILIGDNSAGKTTVLQAIAFLKCCCFSDVEDFLSERNIPVDELCSKLSAKKTITCNVELQLDGKQIKWEISMVRMKDHFELRQERVLDGSRIVLLYRNSVASYRYNAVTGEKDPVMAGTYTSSIIRFTDIQKQSEIYPELTSLKTFFCGIETMDLLSPVNMKRNSKGKSQSIGTGGEKLGTFVKTLSARERVELAQDVRKFLTPFKSVVPKTKQYGWVHLETTEAYAGKMVEISAANVSDGIMRIIALCSLRHLKNASSVILLDEIEDGVNNEHLEDLVQLLRRITAEKKIQIIATTHNTTLLDYWLDQPESALDNNNESILFLYRSDSGAVEARNLLESEIVRKKLTYMYPGEVIQSMTNRELQDSFHGEEV